MFGKKLSLIAYVRENGSAVDKEKQLSAIKEYCRDHNHKVICCFEDKDEPAVGLHRALDCLSHADGLIVYDSTRLVVHRDDSFRELRPLLARVFMHGHRKFIAIADGIENVTPIGQENLIELMNEWSRKEELHGEDVDLVFGQRNATDTSQTNRT